MNRIKSVKIIILLTVLFLTSFSSDTIKKDDSKYENSSRGNLCNNGAVSSADKLATEIGIKILQDGGNAIDAAVGVGFALSVVYPQAGNIGGGGFMVIHFADGKNTSIDYREKAPENASKDMFLDIEGNVIEDLSTRGALASGVPGSVSGMLYALEKYGSKKREDILKYSIDLAENGFKISEKLAEHLNSYSSDFNMFSSS